VTRGTQQVNARADTKRCDVALGVTDGWLLFLGGLLYSRDYFENGI